MLVFQGSVRGARVRVLGGGYEALDEVERLAHG